jgi:diguanylate cyclase (GGDEF)-like protein
MAEEAGIFLKKKYNYAAAKRVPETGMVERISRAKGDGRVKHGGTDWKHVEHELEENNMELRIWLRELEQRYYQRSLLREMKDMLQSCKTAEEIYDVIAHFVETVFSSESGALHIFSIPQNLLEKVASWGKSISADRILSPGECQAFQNRQTYAADAACPAHTCHRAGTFHSSCLCVPILAEGKTIGVLHLQGHGFSVFKQRLATAIAEQASFALCNFKLEEILSSEGIHDPLTGLFNRFYLEKSLELEIERSRNCASPVGVIMFHIDNSMQFNETYSNGTDDLILRELAALLQKNIRSGDIVGRYDGKKFAIVLSEISPDDVQRRARYLCQKVRHIQVSCSGGTSRGISLSSGTAIFPDGGTTAEALLKAADAALQKKAADI